MAWYVILTNFNSKKVYRYNIFDNANFSRGVDKALKKYITYDNFKKEVKSWAMYSFWSKAEYEIAVGDLFGKYPDNFEKIDVWYQIEPNLDILCHYIIDYYNNKPKRKKKLQNG